MSQIINPQNRAQLNGSFRAKITKCSCVGLPLAETNWNCDHVSELLSSIYKSERNLLNNALPKIGRFKVEMLVDPHAASKGIAETLIVWNGKIVSRGKV